MRSYTALRTLYGNLTSNSSAANLTYGDGLINDCYRRIMSERDWPFCQAVANDWTIGDYTTGFIATLSNGSQSVTGSGTSWTSSMIGRFLQTTDGAYYKIQAVSSTTSLTLAIPYNGTSIATNTTYTIRKFNYTLPYDYDELLAGGVKVQVGSNTYVPKEAPTKEFFDLLTSTSNYSSDYPEWFFIFNGQISFFPNPSTSGNQITYTYLIRVIDLSIADYTTGTIAGATNGSQVITGSGTSWTTPMAGRWIQIATSNTAASSGDGAWYQIQSVDSATQITLVQNYAGSTITGGSYTIGQMTKLPEAYQDLPAYYAAMIYFQSSQPEPDRWQLYKGVFEGLYARMMRSFNSKSTNVKIEGSSPDDNYFTNYFNPNLYLTQNTSDV